MGVRVYSNWNKRLSDEKEQLEPYRKYFIICEGANTERFYFTRLIDNRKTLNIKSVIDIRLINREEYQCGLSYPSHLIDCANELKKPDSEIEFDVERDKMVVVFDADIFEYKSNKYKHIVRHGEQTGNIIGVTNPCFELFLLIHYEDALDKDVFPNEEDALKEDKLGKDGMICQALKARTGMNSRKNSRIGELADNVLVAIKQEKRINQDIHKCKGKLTSNIGLIIQSIIDDEGK